MKHVSPAFRIFILAAIAFSCSDTMWGDEKTIYEFQEKQICMKEGNFAVLLDPATLKTTIKNEEKSKEIWTVSQPVLAAGKYEIDEEERTIFYADLHLKITFHLQNHVLRITAEAKKPQTWQWPLISMPKEETSLIWPNHEGYFIPLDDKIWLDFLTANEWNTLEGLYMPFWGIENNHSLLTYLVENPFHNQITFQEKGNDVHFLFEHAFPDNHDLSMPISVRIYLDHDVSPITPAKHFREYLFEKGSFVTLKQKIEAAPRMERLIGALHAYLWGGAPLTVRDIRKNKWVELAKTIVKQSKTPMPGKQIKQLLSADDWEIVKNISGQERAYPYLEKEMTRVLSAVLLSPHLYNKAIWPPETLPADLRMLIKKENLSNAELMQLNSHLFYSAYSNYLNDPSTWGDGVSIQMIDALVESGLDRFLLCVDGWEKIDMRPQVASYAEEQGFLLGTYDGFHSIHDPKTAGTDQSWSTAQFDETLYREGRILRANGKPYSGFNKIGYLLSPIAARPYVERRVNQNFENVPYSYYFMDCDAFGEFYDDYHAGRNVSQSEDVAARVDRIRWIGQTFNVPVGSEGGSYLFANVLSVAEGVFLPVIGWSDADMRNRESEYFIGRWYPSEEPEVFFQQAPLKDRYIRLHVDPRFRLPLYEAVFHDSVITSAHWNTSHFKYANIVQTVALTEILYQTPALYHLNANRFEQMKSNIVKHAELFKKTHSYSYRYALDDFQFLTRERDVQKTRFGELEIISNFMESDFYFQGKKIPGKSVQITLPDTQESIVFSP